MAQIGIYGLGTMGSALALNLAEHGFDVAVTNRETDWIAPFIEEAGDLAARLHPKERLAEFVAVLSAPRVILLMIPSGAPLDAMLAQITPLLAPGDIVIDGGNADFHDTRRRAGALSANGLHFVGLGVSGGEAGARHGPSMMLGGSAEAWAALEPILTAIAARHEGAPCVAHLGPDGAGHFVKTVHNGIEYADMQIIAEIYGLLRNGAAISPPDIAAIFADWNAGPLRSYLVEITAEVLAARDPETGHPVVDVIKDAAGQKGTGRWTVIEALRLGQSASVIEAAVGARGWSSEKETRQAAERVLGGAVGAIIASPEVLAEAFLAARMLAYAQGFRVMAAASDDYGWALDPAQIARIWRAGCIIRADMLDTIADAFGAGAPRGELILVPGIARDLALRLPALRQVVAEAVHAGHAVPSLSGALAWYDTMRRGHGTAALIQAQRDRFGHHGFERLGQAGRHHGPWWD
jgi:6-phosphogluconate dehydrogenase